jgi:hypothetical protein
MKVLGWMVVGVGMAAAAAVESSAWAEGLAGLDIKLNGTGRIGTYAPRSGSEIAPAADGAATNNTRDAAPAIARIDNEAAARVSRPSSGVGEDELMRTDGAVANCRIEVARRRHKPPAKVAAGTVKLRFSVEKSGRVHDAEALTATDTDLEVAACAKRVLSEWVFRKRPDDVGDVERTYSFGEVSPKP